MAEPLSPNPSIPNQTPQIQSPTSPFFLGSNNDELERAQARAAARAAAIRRNETAAAAPNSSQCLDKENILQLFQNCIKLASENKINQKNTWELSLIDHLCDIVKADEEDAFWAFWRHLLLLFQKFPLQLWDEKVIASCTLEAGVKIYSMRVDSVHSEAYKVLGGINRVGQETEEDGTVEDSNISSGQKEICSKKDSDRKLSPLLTLESSFETLNVKKFDAAFAVDPLYHQTSAQFDEGRAKGLLLNTLGIYGRCRVLFDSLEVPAKCSSLTGQHDEAETIDISFARECSEEMVLNMSKKFEVSPTLSEIVNHFDDDDKRPSDTFSSGSKQAEQIDEFYDHGTDFSADTFANGGTWGFDHDDPPSIADEETYGGDPNISSHEDTDDRFAEVDGYLFFSLGFTSKLNSWAGPDHWKFRKIRGSEKVIGETGSPMITKKTRNKKQAAVDIDFLKSSNKDMSDVFAPPKNPKTLMLPTKRKPCNTTLPEDCHYQPENLVKLFLLPNVMCLGRRGRKFSVEWSQQVDDYENMPSGDDETGFIDHFNDRNDCIDVDESNTLVSQPRQVNNIEIQYDRTSKQVDVQALKNTLWESLQESQMNSVQGPGETISFKHALGTFPSDSRAAATLKDISPHMFHMFAASSK